MARGGGYAGRSAPLAQVENQRLLRTLVGLTDRERYILFTHVLDEREFGDLSAELGLGHKGVAAVYYWAVQKIKQEPWDDGA